MSDFEEEPAGEPARRRWSQRMRTDPHFRAIKLAHWQFQIDYARARGWPAPSHSTGGLDFYGRIHEEWSRERQLADPTAWKQESEEIAHAVAEWRAEYEAKQRESDARNDAAQAGLRNRPPTREVTLETGKLDGRLYSEYGEELQAHLGAGRDAEAEALLLKLLDVIEDESEATGNGVAPWYYERLAILYAKRRDHESEVEVLERFARQRHAPGATPPKLLQRLEKARKKLK
jgi:hypothetical protein